MSAVIDTNVLLAAVNRDSAEHDVARGLLTTVANPVAPVYLTVGIVYEFLRVCTHARVLARPLPWSDAWGFMQVLLESPGFEVLTVTTSHWSALEETLKSVRRPSGNLFFDIRTVAIMREYGVRRIYTFDADFLRFPDIEVLDPALGSA